MWSLDLQTELSPYSVTIFCYKCSVSFPLILSEKTTDFESSEILSGNEGLFSILSEYLKDVEPYGKHWKRCFSARAYSYSAASFHTYCNNKGPTVTLVKAGSYVFGGYTDQAWASCKCRDNTRN